MLANNNSTIAINNFAELPYIPYKIVEILLKDASEEANILWKLLKYGDVDCLDKDDLSLSEKKKMIWQGDAEEQDYSIFVKPLVGSSMDTAVSQTQIRLYRYNTMPDTHYQSVICFEADLITNDKTALVRHNGMLVERTDLMESCYLSILNGRDIGIGSGFLIYDRELSRTCHSQLNISNSKSFYGRSVVLALNYMNGDTGGYCG